MTDRFVDLASRLLSAPKFGVLEVTFSVPSTTAVSTVEETVSTTSHAWRTTPRLEEAVGVQNRESGLGGFGHETLAQVITTYVLSPADGMPFAPVEGMTITFPDATTWRVAKVRRLPSTDPAGDASAYRFDLVR